MRILEGFGSGCGFLDFDGDGHLDILLVGSPRCALYRNNGDGTFKDVTQEAGLGREGVWVGCATGDYDNDGDPDLFLSGYRICALYQNRGRGSFADVTAASGITPLPWSTAAVFADLDQDGVLDLYIGGYADFGPHTKQYCTLKGGIQTSCRPFDYDPIPGRCYRGTGNGRFEDVTAKWGFNTAHGRTLGVAAADFNGDGRTDLYLANDEIEADLFQNSPDHRFKNVAVIRGTAYGPNSEVMGGMGVDWGDYDRDGWPDLLVGTYEGEPKPLFRNVKGRGFESVQLGPEMDAVARPWVVWGSLLLDYDNDGALDLMYVNGHVWDNVKQVQPESEYRQPAALFRGDGTGRFTAVQSETLSRPGAYRGLACGDYDNDGDLDLLIQDIDGSARLLRNDCTTGGHSVTVRLEGTGSNRDGYGASVTAVAGGLRQHAEVRTARGYISACDPRLQFGLGAAQQLDLLEIRWPSGKVTRKRHIPAGAQIVAREE